MSQLQCPHCGNFKIAHQRDWGCLITMAQLLIVLGVLPFLISLYGLIAGGSDVIDMVLTLSAPIVMGFAIFWGRNRDTKVVCMTCGYRWDYSKR
jgi:hypothetical protein